MHLKRTLLIAASAVAFMAAPAPASIAMVEHTPSCGTDAGRAWINAAVRAVQQAKGWPSIGTFAGCEHVGGVRYDVHYTDVIVVVDVYHTNAPGRVAWNGHYLEGWWG